MTKAYITDKLVYLSDGKGVTYSTGMVTFKADIWIHDLSNENTLFKRKLYDDVEVSIPINTPSIIIERP